MVDLIPRVALFGNPERMSPQISPDAGKLTFLAPVENVLNIWIGDTGSETFRPITNDRDRGIRIYFWGEDNRHIFYAQDVGGNENWRLYAIDLISGKIRDFTPFENVQVQVLEYNKHHPDEMLIAMNTENEQFHDVYYLNIPTGELSLRAKNPGT
jgi:Tol biopolymer transport system component